MQRYNSFNMIHKGLRALLYDTALTIQQTYFADADEAEIAIEKIEMVLYLFEQHAHHEDNNILPLIELYEHELVEEFEKEHVKDNELGTRLKHLVNIILAAEKDEDKIFCGSAISKSFVEFMVFNLEHMAREERLINQALWKHYTDEQLMLVNQKLVASIPHEEKALNAKWMMRGVNNTEAISWLKGIKNSVPGFVFQSVFSLTDTELPEYRRYIVQEAVMEKEPVDSEMLDLIRA
jgi:hypothetical protein